MKASVKLLVFFSSSISGTSVFLGNRNFFALLKNFCVTALLQSKKFTVFNERKNGPEEEYLFDVHIMMLATLCETSSYYFTLPHTSHYVCVKIFCARFYKDWIGYESHCLRYLLIRSLLTLISLSLLW